MLIRCACGWEKNVKDELRGKKAKCPKCETVMIVEPALPAVKSSPAIPEAETATSVMTTASSLLSSAGGALKNVGSLIPKAKTTIEAVAVTPSAVNPAIARFTLEEQDPEKVAAIVEKVQQILTAGESMECIAIQEKPIANWFPDAVVLTSRRFIIYRPKMLGRVSFEDYIWRDLRDVKLKEDIIGATLSFSVVGGKNVALDYLPKKQARALYRVAQNQEQLALEERRQRTMEEQRSAAGGVVIQTAVGTPAVAAPPAAVDPVAKLQQLKGMLDAGLISQDEFDQKKSSILAAI